MTSPRRRSRPARSRSAAPGSVPPAGVRGEHGPHQLVPVPAPAPRSDVRAEGGVECEHAHGIALAGEQEGQAGGELAGVPELGRQVLLGRRPRHGRTHVEQEVRPQIGLLLELLDVVAVRPAVHAPVDVAHVVTRLVHPVLRELHREAAVRRAVEARDEPLHHLPGHELQPAECGQLPGCQQVCAAGSLQGGVAGRTGGRRSRAGRRLCAHQRAER
jgi:hypothetical protein